MTKNKYNYFKIGGKAKKAIKKKASPKKKAVLKEEPAAVQDEAVEKVERIADGSAVEVFAAENEEKAASAEPEGFPPVEHHSEDAPVFEDQESVSKVREVISFALGEGEYAIDILRIIEIVIVDKINALSNVEEYVEGLFNLRDEMIPVVNLEMKLGLPNDPGKHFGIVCSLGDKKICILTRRIIEVIYLKQVSVFDPPRLISGVNDYLHKILKYTRDATESVVSLVNLHNLFSSEEKLELEKAIKAK